MNELQAILAAREELRAAGETAVVATVVATQGSTFRRAGARLVLGPDGWRAGSVSGGCLEADLVETARERLAAAGGGPLLVTFDTSRDDDVLFGHGTGCQGTVELLLEWDVPAGGDAREDPLAFLARCQARREAAVLATVISPGPRLGQRGWLTAGVPDGTAPSSSPASLLEGPLGRGPDAARLGVDARATLATGRSRRLSYPATVSGRPRPGDGAVPATLGTAGVPVTVRFEFVPPPVSLTIYGGGPDVGPVVRLAAELGWWVRLAGSPALGRTRAPWLALARQTHFGSPSGLARHLPPEPGGAVLLMTHNYLADLALLETLAAAGPPSPPPRYLGLVGPKRRRERLLADLARSLGRPVRPDWLRQVFFAPAGLDLGADEPEQIALAIVAEIQGILAGRPGGGHLRERLSSIHQPAAGSGEGECAEAVLASRRPVPGPGAPREPVRAVGHGLPLPLSR